MVEVREVLRGWLEGAGLRRVAERAGVDRKTARRYVAAAEAEGLCREAGVEALTDGLVGAVVAAVRPARPNGHGSSWGLPLAREEQITKWVVGGKGQDPLSVVKIEELLVRQGCVVPYRTLHRFAVERWGFRVKSVTMRINDGEPGVECQIDFAQMGFILDPETGKKRRVHALIFTAVLSRHMFVWLTYSQTLVAMIAGCEAAWDFYGGVFKVLIPDNLRAVVAKVDAVNPRLSVGWLDYSQHVGFATDPARVRTPQDKPRVERAVQFVRGNFWAGETFTDLADAQTRVVHWCSGRAGMRIHGTTAARPLEMFTEVEASCLLPVPVAYDVPVFTRAKVHRDFHVEVAKALYSLPQGWIGQYLDARADSELVRLFAGGALVKTHPRQHPGGRSTDRADLPVDRAGYAMRDLSALIASCAGHGPNVGIYAERLLDDPLHWTRMRSVYRLVGLVRRYGPGPVETACTRSLDLDVVSVSKIASMLEKATERQAPVLPCPVGAPTGRFARDPAEYATHATTQLTLIPGGANAPDTKAGDHPMTMTSTAAAPATGPLDPVGADLTRTLRALKLGGLKDTLPERLVLARQCKMGHAAFLDLLLSDEVTRRESRSAMLRARTAGLDPSMRLDTWDEPDDLTYDRILLSDLTSLRFAEAGHGVLILGPVGVGKTHLATALGHIGIRRRLSVHASRTDKLFTRLRAARLDNTLQAEMRKLARIDLLILDHFALRNLDATETNDFYEIIVERHRKASTIVMSAIT